jgi:hypothetical protein
MDIGLRKSIKIYLARVAKLKAKEDVKKERKCNEIC